MEKDSNNQEILKLDDIMKVLFKLSEKVVVNMMNSLFNENLDYNNVTVSYGNNEFIDDELERIRGDLFLTITKNQELNSYHIEFQTLNDKSMMRRMFRYGFEKALESRSGNLDSDSNEEIIFHYPKQLVIFLEENENIKDELSFTLRMPDRRDIKFNVPVVKYWKYSADDLKQQKMYALLPLQVVKLRKVIRGIFSSNKSEEEKTRLISEEFKKLLETVKTVTGILDELYKNKEIVGMDLEKILIILSNITDYLYNKYGAYDNVSKEVKTMVTTLYNPAIAEKAKMEGIEKGIEKGKLEVAKRMLEKGMDIETIIELTALPEEEIREIQQ